MKKNKLYTFVALALMLGTTSCGDSFLTEEPSSKLPLDGYYNSEARCLESAVAAYHPMQWFDYFGGWAPLNIVWDSMGDDLYVGGSGTSDQGQIHLISQFRSDPRNTIGGAWTTAYSGINRSIRLIDNAKGCEGLDETTRKAFVAEGSTLRAWYYLVLWKLWGNIPLYMENLTLPYIAEQKSATEVYNTIIENLEQVIDSKVLPMKRESGQEGRMTQAAAEMIFADYVMYQKDESRYAKALSYMKDIIDSQKYDLVVGADYDFLFDNTHEWSSEIILDVNYVSQGGKRDWGSANATGGTVMPTLIAIPDLNYNTTGDNTNTGKNAEFFDGGWGFAPISIECYESFEEGDLRRDIALINLEQYTMDMLKVGKVVTYGSRYQQTGINLRKYQARPGYNEGYVGANNMNWTNNLHLYRFAETLLNAAELALATGDNSAAQNYFDRVRTRAGLGQKPVSVDNILEERRHEFVGEGKRYFDLVRTDRAASVLAKGAGRIPEANKLRKLQWVKNSDMQENKGGQYDKFILVPKSELPAKLFEGEGNKNNYAEGKDGRKLYWTCAKTEWKTTGTAVPEREAWTATKKYIPIPQSEIEAAKGTIIQNEY